MSMKKEVVMFIIILAVTAAGCELEQDQGPVGPPAGTQQTYSAGGVEFIMIAVPAKTFPGDLNPDEPFRVNKPFWLAETETTYKLWNAVYEWAVLNGYTFAHAGQKGNDSAVDKSVLHPVTGVSWFDVLAWCNALTEWHNGQTGEELACVYLYNNSILRDSSAVSSGSDLAVTETAKGFRLPSKKEFRLATQYRGNDPVNTVLSPMDRVYWTSSTSASGATDTYSNSEAPGEVAWFDYNSEGSTHEVKQKTPNTLGFYDMSGNVFEHVFFYLNGGSRALCGGYSSTASYACIRSFVILFPQSAYEDTGFRVAKNM
jgi:formylglycine-generating enzyme required for sulfatase activity